MTKALGVIARQRARDSRRGRPLVEEEPRIWLITARVTLRTFALAKMLARRRKESLSDLIRTLIEERVAAIWGKENPPGLRLFCDTIQKKGRKK